MMKSGMGIVGTLVAAGLAASGTVLADTTDVTWQNRVELLKEGEHCADDPNCFNRYHPAIPAATTAAPIAIETGTRIRTRTMKPTNRTAAIMQRVPK